MENNLHQNFHLRWSHVLHLFFYRVDVAFPLKSEKGLKERLKT